MIFNISLSELETQPYLEKFFITTQDTLSPIIIIIIVHLCVIISSGTKRFSKYKAIPKTFLSPAALNVCLNEVFGEGENVQSLWHILKLRVPILLINQCHNISFIPTLGKMCGNDKCQQHQKGVTKLLFICSLRGNKRKPCQIKVNKIHQQ